MMVTITTSETVARRMVLAVARDARRLEDSLNGMLGRGASPDSDDIRIIADAGAEARAALHALQVALVSLPLPVYPFPITEAEARVLDGNR